MHLFVQVLRLILPLLITLKVESANGHLRMEPIRAGSMIRRLLSGLMLILGFTPCMRMITRMMSLTPVPGWLHLWFQRTPIYTLHMPTALNRARQLFMTEVCLSTASMAAPPGWMLAPSSTSMATKVQLVVDLAIRSLVVQP